MPKSLPTFRLPVPGTPPPRRDGRVRRRRVACGLRAPACARLALSRACSHATRQPSPVPRVPEHDGVRPDRLGPRAADRRALVRAQQRLEPAAAGQRAPRSRVRQARRPVRQRGGGRRPCRHRAVRGDLRLHDADLRRRAVPAHRPRGDRHRSDNTLGQFAAGRFERGADPGQRARPSAGTDSQITIYQPSTDRLWEYWHFRRERDGWHARWGGAIDDVSSSPGYYTPSVVERRAVGLGRERHEPAAGRRNDDAGRTALRPHRSRPRHHDPVPARGGRSPGPRSARTAPAPRLSCRRERTCG